MARLMEVFAAMSALNGGPDASAAANTSSY
jgi:hypothetical protein